MQFFCSLKTLKTLYLVMKGSQQSKFGIICALFRHSWAAGATDATAGAASVVTPFHSVRPIMERPNRNHLSLRQSAVAVLAAAGAHVRRLLADRARPLALGPHPRTLRDRLVVRHALGRQHQHEWVHTDVCFSSFLAELTLSSWFVLLFLSELDIFNN